MSKLSKKDKELVDEFITTFKKAEEEIDKQEKITIDMINEIDDIKKDLYNNEPSQLMFITHKKWKTLVNDVEYKLFKLYNDLGEIITDHNDLFNIVNEK